MTKKLRRNFILIAMASVLAVLALIIGIINVLNYSSVTSNADSVINVLIENGGKFNNVDPSEGGTTPPDLPQTPPSDSTTTDESISKNYGDSFGERKDEKGMDVETPFETRYVSLTYENDTYTVIASHVAAISSDQAITMAKEVINNNKGYYNNYRYSVTDTSDTAKLIILVDCTRNLENANNFMLFSLIISASGLVAVFVLVFFLSKLAVKPIVEGYERQKRFITNAGHELKTPLTIISANNEMIEMTQNESEFTEAISKQVVRMTGMVKNLTSLARLDEGAIQNQTTFNISLTLADLISNFIQAFESKNKTLKFYIDEDIEYKGDMNLIKQLFSITLDNALKYSKTFCNVHLKKQGNKIMYKISNDGESIAEGNQNRCFERFYRTDSSRASAVEGSGIGLSIAKEIVNLHKGTIKATGLPGNVFEIEAIL